MKKINTTKLVSLLAVLCMITSAFVGSTLAKYTTKGSAYDTARVAKFGVVVSATGSLYSDAYAASTNVPAVWTAKEGTDSISVVADPTENNIVAPGTKSDDKGLKLVLSGTPEVNTEVVGTVETQDIYLKAGKYAAMTKIGVLTEQQYNSYEQDTLYTYDTTNADKPKYVAATAFNKDAVYYAKTSGVELAADYYPVKYTLKDDAGSGSKKTNLKAFEVANEIAKKFKSTVQTATANTTTTKTKYEIEASTGDVIYANTNFDTKFKGMTITWEWAFEGNDAEDTILGNLMANNSDTVIVYGDEYQAVTVEEKLVKDSEGDVIGSLDTIFDLDITVNQLD